MGWVVAPLAIACTLSGPARAVVDPQLAAQIFSEAKTICERDAGRFWGRGLCGPMLLVDPTDRTLLANEADGAGVLKPAGAGLYSGVLPASEILSNTPIDWSGKRWTELLIPLRPKGDDTTAPPGWRPVELAHELFHRIQPDLDLTRPEAGNRHLDTLEGRYLMQLEWRALTRALQATTVADRRAATLDALAFRAERYRLFPTAAAEEHALEIDEGIPEYTGVKLGLTTPQAQVAYAEADLSAFLDAPTFVRAFAYATGPAYGLLLDRADPSWRSQLASDRRFDELLSAALKVPDAPPADLKAREARYDNGALRATEIKREDARQARLTALRAKLVDGPVLRLPLRHANYQFNPQTLIPLGDAGTVYPTMRLSDDWGVLEVDDGALLRKGLATVSAAHADVAGLKGDGWTLTLKPGWSLKPGDRHGDLQLIGP
jgi:hypothetical protein